MPRQFHRPARLDPELAEQIEGSADTAISSQLAHHAAQVLIGGFTEDDAAASPESHSSPESGLTQEPVTREGVIRAVAQQGVDTVAELWADSPATTLPGTLWRLYLVREWIRRDPELIERRYATRVDLSQADEAALTRFESARAEGHRAPAPQEVKAAIDRVLTGEVAGSVTEIAGLLRVTAAFMRALAAGSHPQWIEDDADELADRVTLRESALLVTADELAESARRAAVGLLD